MLRNTISFSLLALLPLFWFGAVAGAQSTPEVLSIELNKLEQAGSACRFHLVVENSSDIAFTKFSANLVFFDLDGVISTRISVDLGKLRPNKTFVMSFAVESLNCVDVGRVLLNEVTECQHSAKTEFDCTDAVRVNYRGPVELLK